jgi:hypothetical protein
MYKKVFTSIPFTKEILIFMNRAVSTISSHHSLHMNYWALKIVLFNQSLDPYLLLNGPERE